MKTEINLENKAKFFAQYWGQRVISSGTHTHEVCSSVNLKHEAFYLELKPISSITDEDFLEVMWKQFPFQPTFKKGKMYAEHLNIIQSDYLRSKGYALPWMGLSVEEMVEAGWIKLKSE